MRACAGRTRAHPAGADLAPCGQPGTSYLPPRSRQALPAAATAPHKRPRVPATKPFSRSAGTRQRRRRPRFLSPVVSQAVRGLIGRGAPQRSQVRQGDPGAETQSLAVLVDQLGERRREPQGGPQSRRPATEHAHSQHHVVSHAGGLARARHCDLRFVRRWGSSAGRRSPQEASGRRRAVVRRCGERPGRISGRTLVYRGSRGVRGASEAGVPEVNFPTASMGARFRLVVRR